ncbi:uncharacterized protein LOC115632498 isoform X2 [Scaptodrosophila lebanonensis]|uniref:Uncharacterized protein LOC115632498 isoform X2 n=1 Tax=Drosophila lebanonensis TaxID=7225 RepID=A0A6J2UEI5_DROLE|nr:uncharacterized protein LOC115632498 isoform X2 [Scaptodrosophila lebanonensis]
MQKLLALLPGQQSSSSPSHAPSRHSVALEPEIGFQITIETQKPAAQSSDNELSFGSSPAKSGNQLPELNVHLIAARHLPSLFGFKIVQGYLIKVKLFPGTKRLDSSIQTNTWPKFNENFKFPLVPDIKPSLKHKHSSAFAKMRASSIQGNSEFSTPDELFAGQFVVFTVYALLELPAATYRSLKDKSTNFVQRIVESSSGNIDETKQENGSAGTAQKTKGKKKTESPRDSMPPLTISEARRNIGSVTCYLEPKLFKRNTRNGCYSTEELWLPIKDITTTVSKAAPSSNNNLTNAPKGIVEIALEVRDLSERPPVDVINGESSSGGAVADAAVSVLASSTTSTASSNITPASKNWQRLSAEVKRKIGISNAPSSSSSGHNLVLRITTARMRCSHKVKDELEATAGSVYVKTTVFEHGIYIDAWKSPTFYPSLSTKWDGVVGSEATLQIPLQSLEQLDNIVVRTTLATKLKMNKKLVLGTVYVGASGQASSTGLEQLRLLQEAPFNERVAAWHCFQ